jgi:xanthine dehydrogenase small subunit
MTPRPIRFVHRGTAIEVTGPPPTTTVLAWLREHAGLTGTKEGCNEGDCGACTVMVGELDGEAVRWRTVNACLQFLPTLDGRALRTVQDLPADHPAPRAMVDCHGSQCGFCTPGFVVSLAALYAQRADKPSRAEIADALSGNLCRCTGYRPILDAGEAMYAAPRLAADDRDTVAALKRLRDDPPLDYAAPNPATGLTDRFLAPRTLDALAEAAAAHPQATLLAGSTDIGLWVNKQFRPLPLLLSVNAVPELRRIHQADGVLHIGAGAALEDAWAALAERLPALRELWRRFASPPVRRAGTLGGNLVNGSPIGDTAPVLLALGARLVLRHGRSTRTLPLDGFYTGYMLNQRQPGELLVDIEVPLPGPATRLRAWKQSKRFDCDISALACGLALTLDGDVVAEARFAFGGLAATARRAPATEAAVRGKAWTESALRDGMTALAQDFQPLTDLRGSSGYRLRSARALLHRLWLETRPVDPLPPTATQVRAVQA